MPVDQEQLTTDLDYVRSLPEWKDGNEEQRRTMARELAIKSAAAQDADQHHAFASKLWEEADPDGWATKSGKFVGTSLKELALSMPAMGPAVVFAAADPFLGEDMDTGSGIRLKRGVADLGNAVIQTTKQLHPDDNQEQLASALDSLRQDIHNNALPEGVHQWLAGEDPPKDDAETQTWLDALTHGLGKLAVKADTRLQFNPGLRTDIVDWKSEPKLLESWLRSDRNPWNSGAQDDGTTLGAKDFLADYVATRDPSSWAAFVSRVTETESQHKTRLLRANEGEARLKNWAKDAGWMGDLAVRGADMQTSPIDMATAVLPLMRGVRLLKAARAAQKGEGIVLGVLKGAGEEALQEGLTEKLQDARASNEQVLTAAAMGGIGSGIFEGTLATAGHLMRDRSTPLAKPPTSTSANEGPVIEPSGPITPTMPDAAVEGSTPSTGATPPTPTPTPLTTVQRKMAERTLVSQGVEPEVAAGVVEHLGITPDLAPEELRDHVLRTFQERGGQLPDALPKRHLDQADAYIAQGYTPEEAQVHAENSRAVHEQDVQAAHETNRQLVTTINDEAAQRAQEQAQNAATDAALANGPKTMMDVATRAGRVDSGRLNFSMSQSQRARRFRERAGPGSTLDTPNQRRVANAFHEAVATDLNGAITKYIDKFGNVVDTDLARELDPEYAASREGRQEHSRGTSHTANTLAKYVYERLLKIAKPGLVIFNAGGPGSGKSSTLNEATRARAAIVYDTVMAEAPRAIDQINQALDAGHHVTINYIHQPLEAAVRNTIDRAADPTNGRVVEAYATARAHKNAQDTIFKVQAHFANDPRVRVNVIDNTGFAKRPSSLQELQAARYQEPLETLTQRATFEAQSHLHERQRQNPTDFTEALARRVLRPSGGTDVAGNARSHGQGERGLQSREGTPGRAQRLRPEQAQTPLRSLIQNTRKLAREAARLLNNALPGIVHDKLTFVTNPAELLASSYAAEHSFTPAEIEQMQEAEGFFDNRTGHTIIFTDHIDVRPGESERAAVARVILHERVGHDGFNHLYERDAKFKSTWDNLVKGIDSTELDAIARDYPDLAGDRNQLALEWFARQVERIAGERAGAGIDGGLKGTLRQMWDAFKALYARVFKGFAQSLQTEHDLRQLITKATDAARNGTAIPTTAESLRLQFALGGTRVMHTQGQPFRVNDLATRTILTGSSLPRAFHEAVQSTERERRACDQTAAQIGRDLNTAIESHAERTGTPLAQVYDMVHTAMSGAPGTNAVLLQVDPVLAERARVARNFIDDLSIAVAQTLPRGPLRNNIILNQGAWMRRSYAAFDPNSNWNFDNVMQAARAGEQLGGRPARDIVRQAAALLSRQNQYPAGMRDTHGLPRAGSVLEADMRDLMDRDTWANALTGSATVRKNVSSLITRQDIPAELRALMGEDTNPIKRFANSTAFQVQFIQRHQQQQTLRTIGLGTGLFANQRAGVNITQIPDNHRWSPLAGLWTTPQLWAALQRVDGTERGNDFLAKMGEAVRWLGSEAKLNRVAMNPDSWLVNAAGNVVALCQTGDLFSGTIFSRIGQAIALMRAGKAKSGDVVNATTEAITDANRAMIARLNASGVLGETFSARDLEASLPRHILQWIDQDASGLRDRSIGALKGALYGQAAGRGLGLTGRAVGAVVGAAAGATAGHQRILGWQQTLANYVMTGPDALGRLTGFLGNLETAHAAGLTGDAAFSHAAERTRNTFPDYSKLPAVLRSLSKYGLAGSFIAFQYEVYRNTAWNLRYAIQDLSARDAHVQQLPNGSVTTYSANMALRTRAAKRLIGASMIGYLAAGGLQALFQNAAGTDDERNNRWRRWFAAPWESHAVLAFTDYTDKSVSYFNTSYLVPQTTIAELVRAAMDGKDPADAAGNVVGQVWEQFMGSSVHIAPIVQALMNVDRMGRPITFQEGIAGAAERLDYAGQTILEPGWAAKLERLEYALRGAERRGRTFSVQEEIERFLGIRKFTRTWPDMVKRRYDVFAREYTAIRSEANKAIGTNLPGAKQSAIQTANAKIAELSKQLAEYDSDLPRLGVPRTLIDTARNDSTVPKTFHPLEIDPATNNRVRSVKQ